MNQKISSLSIQVFADGADLAQMQMLRKNPLIKGFTTNPTLMKAAGVDDYESFAREVLDEITDVPVSFEVLADDFPTMEAQARRIASWGGNVYVKIPVSNSEGVSSAPLVGRLSRDGVKVNVTAVFTMDQVKEMASVLYPDVAANVSVFAGRIADTGRDPVPMMREAVETLAKLPKVEVIWASPREVLNIFHAEEAGCHIITVTGDLLKKVDGIGKDLGQFSQETVTMFLNDAVAAQYSIKV